MKGNTVDTLTETMFTKDMTECTGTRYHVNPDAPEEGTDIHHEGPCPVHPGAAPIVSVGWDGANNPMYRYKQDLPLPEHMRRIVAPEDRPDYPKVGHDAMQHDDCADCGTSWS